MDLSRTIIPKSDQINAEDLLTGPVTVTVESVSEGGAEQPVDIHLVEYPGRAYRPSKTMRRVLVKAWGKESDGYTGHRMTLYRDPDVKFGGQKVGGIKVSHLSHIERGFSMAQTETKGKRVAHTVDALTDVARPTPAPTPTEPTADQVAACTDVDALKALYDAAKSPEMRALIRARKAELIAQPATLDNPLDYSGDDLGDGAM